MNCTIRTTNKTITTFLRSIEVRPIYRHEKAEWDTLMRHHHYLGFRCLIGKSIRYVALYKKKWVALLGWSSAALKCTARDQWIGWPSIIKIQRLDLMVNNTRFLILPHIQIPNLASRILALNIKRLCQDWKLFYGHPILLAETFVDPRYYTGTCYKAAGWVPLGHTSGFAKSNDHYTHHGNPKMVLVRPLCKNAKILLRSYYPKIKHKKEVKPMQLSLKNASDLIECLLQIPDPRMLRGIRHRKVSILAIAICAIMSDAGSFIAIAEWAQRCSQNMLKRLRCRYNKKTKRYEPPSEPTIRRFLQKVDPKPVDKVLYNWLLSLVDDKDSSVGVDGKIIKGAKQDNGRQVNLLSAFLNDYGIVVAQCEVDDKTNEIPMVPPLLDPLKLEGRVVTLDALHTQKNTANYLVDEKHADYIFTVKDNQKSLKDDIRDLNMVSFPPSTSNH